MICISITSPQHKTTTQCEILDFISRNPATHVLITLETYGGAFFMKESTHIGGLGCTIQKVTDGI
jgi:hypothetical protein